VQNVQQGKPDKDAQIRFVLNIAASDSCGGAGIHADIKTITGLGCHTVTAVTAITAQNSHGVFALHKAPEGFISLQIETIVKDLLPDAVKIGMLPGGSAIREVAGIIIKTGIENIVLDPVMKASAGGYFLEDSSITVMKKILLPLVNVITPNMDEAGALIGDSVGNIKEMEEAAKELKQLGPDVIITGGHLQESCVDLLYDGRDMHHFPDSKIDTANTHGSGCVFSASVAAFLALDHNLVDAARLAHMYTRRAIERGYPCGSGPGPVYPGPLAETKGS
jgi:hydroxymethylpyrimidine kinase/phosphomethylpyrimidine kinase